MTKTMIVNEIGRMENMRKNKLKIFMACYTLKVNMIMGGVYTPFH